MQRIFIENADEKLLRSINDAFEEAGIDYDIDNAGRYMIADNDVNSATEILEKWSNLEFDWEIV